MILGDILDVLKTVRGIPISCYIHVDMVPAMVHSQLWPAFTNLWQSMQPFAESHTPLPTCVNPCWIFTRLYTAHTTISHLPIYIYHMWQHLWLGTMQSWLLLRLLEILFPSWASGSFLRARAVNRTIYGHGHTVHGHKPYALECSMVRIWPIHHTVHSICLAFLQEVG